MALCQRERGVNVVDCSFNWTTLVLVLVLVLTMFPLVASPSRPPNVMTGDMQAQYKKRTDAKHCRLRASLMSLHRKGAFLLMSFTRPPKILTDKEEGILSKILTDKEEGILSYDPDRQRGGNTVILFLFFHEIFDILEYDLFCHETTLYVILSLFSAYFHEF